MRIVVMVLCSIMMSGGGVALAQGESTTRVDAVPPQEDPEEVIVRGRRIGELRFEVEAARERAYDVFNEINTNDEFDVSCREQSRSGTRVPQQVCRARFEHDVSADAAREYMAALAWRCPTELTTQDCMFSDYSSGAISAAQGEESRALSKREEMEEEILRLANQDDRFAQAILDFYEASQQYEAARKRRDD